MRLEKLSCRRRVALLFAYLDRELPAAQRARLARHRRACRDCASLLESLERAARALRALRRGSVPVRSRRALRARLAASLRP